MVLYNITLKYESVKEKHGDKICFDPADEDRKLK